MIPLLDPSSASFLLLSASEADSSFCGAPVSGEQIPSFSSKKFFSPLCLSSLLSGGSPPRILHQFERILMRSLSSLGFVPREEREAAQLAFYRLEAGLLLDYIVCETFCGVLYSSEGLSLQPATPRLIYCPSPLIQDLSASFPVKIRHPPTFLTLPLLFPNFRFFQVTS